MPTFYAQKTTVQLSVADLGWTTTLNPHTQQSIATSESIRNVAHEFARGSKDGTLTETPLYTKDGKKSHVRFLGKHGNMPFFMVHAGKNFFDLTTKERNRRPDRVPLAGMGDGESASTAVGLDGGKVGVRTSKHASIEPNRNYKPPFIPHALCLTVFLSKSSFVCIKDRATMSPEMIDIKIDVYFNGALCGSHYVPRRYSSELYTMTEHIVRFTGSRIGRLIEKPWVIVPSGQNANGDLQEDRSGKVAHAGTQQRWNDISDALMAEADKNGQDEKGGRPVIGEYLESLAQLPMPKEVEDMQKAGSSKFGLLDVVIIWGKGKKYGPDAPYIVKPTPIRNEGFTVINLDQAMDHSPISNVTTATGSTYTAPQSLSEALANAKPVDDYADTFPSSVSPSLIPTPNGKTNLTTSSPPNERLFPAIPFETPIRRSRGHYYDILTTRKTLSEEINSITTAARLKPKTGYNPTFMTNAPTTRGSHTPKFGSSPLSSAPMTREHTHAQTKVVKYKLRSPTHPATSPGIISTPRMQDGETDTQFLTSLRERTSAAGSKRREGASTQLTAEAPDRGFLTPALGTDCSITYAPGGYFRNVGAARGAVFKEGGVIMGARFVVGG